MKLDPKRAKSLALGAPIMRSHSICSVHSRGAIEQLKPHNLAAAAAAASAGAYTSKASLTDSVLAAQVAAASSGGRLRVPCVHPYPGSNPSHTPGVPSGRLNGCFHSFRLVVVFLAGLAVGFMALLRLNITISILNMVNQTGVYMEENPDKDPEEYFASDYEETGEFLWNNEMQQVIVSYYMISFALLQLPATKLAIKLGPQRAMCICLCICSISNLLTPYCAYLGWRWVLALRLANGAGAAAVIPVSVRIIELWMPKAERQAGLTLVLTLQALMFSTSTVISGYLASYHWKWTFYAPAGACLVFCLLWMALVRDCPADSALVSDRELATLCACHEDSQTGASGEETKATAVPWTRALRHKGFYALTGAYFLYYATFGSLTFLIPMYMRQVLQVPIVENGMICFMINSTCFFSTIWPYAVLAVLQNKLGLSLTSARRVVMLAVGLVVTSTVLAVAHFHAQQITLFSLCRLFHMSCDLLIASTLMSHYADSGASSILYALINGTGGLATVFFCMLAGRLLDVTGQSIECWSGILYTVAIMNVALVAIFCTAMTSEPSKLRPESDSSPTPNQSADCEKADQSKASLQIHTAGASC